MDIFAIFRGSPESQIRKLRKKVKEPHGDPAVRENAARRLFEMGTPEALRALLDRFTISCSPSVRDEREKEEVFGWFVSLGESAVPSLVEFLKSERTVYWPIRALRAILPEEKLAETLEAVLRFHWENPPASSGPKVQILRSLQGLSSPTLDEIVRLFLKDEDDDVRLAAIEQLMDQGEEYGREAVLTCYAESEDRPRIRAQIIDRLAEHGWTVRGFRPLFEETLPEGYLLTREARLKKVGN